MAPLYAWGSPEWVDAYIACHGFPPIAGGENDPPKDDPPKDDPPPADPPKDSDSDDDKVTKDDDDKAKARKHERWAKKERDRADAAEAELKKLRDADKSDHERALDEARKTARDEALSEAEKDRRSERLEVAVTRLSRGVKIGEGDDAETVRFDDELVLPLIERKIANDDLDVEVYDDEGKVNTEALTMVAATLLTSKSSLRIDGKENGKPKGDADARKGDKASKDLESMTPAQHAERKYPATK